MLQHVEAILRVNAIILPSAERENRYALSELFGDPEFVRYSFPPVANEKSTTPKGPSTKQWSIINIPLPSSSQTSGPGRVSTQPTVVTLRSVPPNAGTT